MKTLLITLRAARVNRGFTVQRVSEQTGKHPDTIRKYEIDSSDIPRDLMVALIDLYKIPDSHIFFGRESSFHGLLEEMSADTG